MSRVQTNIPSEPLRWSVIRAAEEFGLDQVTLRKRLVKAESIPDDTGCYGTLQIISAVFDDSKTLRDLEVKERTENYRLKNEAIKGNLLDKGSMLAGLEISYQSVKNIVMGSLLSEKDKKDILDNLARCPLILDEVSRKQALEISKKE